MSITEAEQRCNVLRQDLKIWEAKFAKENEGRKAGRDDIKANAEISHKYKEYSRLRTQLTARTAPHTPSKRATKRPITHDVGSTPKGPPRVLTLTPSKRKRDDEDNLDVAATSLQFLSPRGPSVIGPTPQRDGIVLGLFDMLPAGTPSKSRTALGDVEINVLQTPSKNTHDAASEASLESRARGERTPLSSGKRFLFNQFVTPKKRKVDEEGTPTSTTRGLSTPAFLRRNVNLDPIDEVDESTPRPAPWKRRGLGRSLSAMIQAMRKDEEDRLDEEADIMREMEMEEQGILPPPSKKVKVPEIQVEDSQAPMPLGPDRGSESDDDDEDTPELGPDGKPRKAWKKKGLKRQTRRVIMRPNLAKPKPQAALQIEDDSEDDGDKIAETQVDAKELTRPLDFEEDESDYASDASHTPKKSKTKKKVEEKKEGAKEGLKAAGRKVKATANANFRRLKIKSSKGASGGRSRFGRRR